MPGEKEVTIAFTISKNFAQQRTSTYSAHDFRDTTKLKNTIFFFIKVPKLKARVLNGGFYIYY